MSQPGWKDLPIGDVLQSDTAVTFKTGDWRSSRPEHNEKTCINCMFCYINCPDSAVKVKDGKMIGFDFDFCKGCGICANVCPTKPEKAIKMVSDR